MTTFVTSFIDLNTTEDRPLNRDTNFYIEARNGTVEIIKEQEVEKPVRRFSLYGED